MAIYLGQRTSASWSGCKEKKEQKKRVSLTENAAPVEIRKELGFPHPALKRVAKKRSPFPHFPRASSRINQGQSPTL
jgi:hypothetical protein